MRVTEYQRKMIKAVIGAGNVGPWVRTCIDKRINADKDKDETISIKRVKYGQIKIEREKKQQEEERLLMEIEAYEQQKEEEEIKRLKELEKQRKKMSNIKYETIKTHLSEVV